MYPGDCTTEFAHFYFILFVFLSPFRYTDRPTCGWPVKESTKKEHKIPVPVPEIQNCQTRLSLRGRTSVPSHKIIFIRYTSTEIFIMGILMKLWKGKKVLHPVLRIRNRFLDPTPFQILHFGAMQKNKNYFKSIIHFINISFYNLNYFLFLPICNCF
jgi:hypothetical protein